MRPYGTIGGVSVGLMLAAMFFQQLVAASLMVLVLVICISFEDMAEKLDSIRRSIDAANKKEAE